MATYLELSDLIESPSFKRRARMAMMFAALAALVDAGSSAALKTYAREVLKGNINEADQRRAVLRCVVDPAIRDAGESATDAQIQAVVDVMFSALA